MELHLWALPVLDLQKGVKLSLTWSCWTYPDMIISFWEQKAYLMAATNLHNVEVHIPRQKKGMIARTQRWPVHPCAWLGNLQGRGSEKQFQLASSWA